MKWNTVISVIGLLSAATSAIPLAEIERNYDGHLTHTPILPRHAKRVTPGGRRPDEVPNTNPAPRPIPRNPIPDFSPSGKTPSEVKAQKPNYDIRKFSGDGSTDQTRSTVKVNPETSDIDVVLKQGDMAVRARTAKLVDDGGVGYSNAVRKRRGGGGGNRNLRTPKGAPAPVVLEEPEMKAAMGPKDFLTVDPYAVQPETGPEAPTVAKESLQEFTMYEQAGIFRNSEKPFTLTTTSDVSEQVKGEGLVLSRGPVRGTGWQVNNPVPDLPQGQEAEMAYVSPGYSPRSPISRRSSVVSALSDDDENDEGKFFPESDGHQASPLSPVSPLFPNSPYRNPNVITFAPHSDLARQSQPYQLQQKRQEVQDTTTKRDIITQISQGEQNATSSSRADQMAQIEEYIWAFDMVRQNVTSIVEPFIIEVLNGTNSYLGEAIAWSLYSLTVPDTPVSGPFQYGLSKLTSAANATGTTSDTEMEWLEEVEQFYFSIWNETVTAVNKTGLLDDLASLASYLLPEDPTLLPDSFRNTDPHGEEPFLPFLESMYQYNGYYYTANQVANGTSPYVLNAWDFADASNPYSIQWWSNSTSNSTTNSTSSLNSTLPANGTFTANARRALKPVPINFSA